MHIVFLDAKTLGPVSNMHVLDRLGDVKIYPTTSHSERISRCLHADIIITCKVIIDKELIDLCPQLKLICVAATGINNIDVTYARSKGIEVRNVENYSTESVAQHTVAMVLHLLQKLSYFDAYVKNGDYCKSDMFTHYGPEIFELKGKRIGIVGLGNIGKRVARILEVFGAEIVYYSTTGKNNNNDYLRVEFDELVVTSDIVCIHAPLSEFTRNLFTLSVFKLMKPTAILINMGRGGIVNETDLAEALNSELIAGAGLDVFEKEPIVPENALFQVKNLEKLLLSPHVAWTSLEARTCLIEKIANNISGFLEITVKRI